MKNRKIPGFPLPENQDAIKFHFFKKLSYTTRMLMYLGCITAGFLLQILTVSVWPGALLLIPASMLMLIKGLSAKPSPEGRQSSWTKTDMERIRQINQIKQNINKWDKDALDISNSLGCATFFMVFVVISFVCVVVATNISGRAASIFIIDSIILIAPIWFNGMRIKGHQDVLYIKADIIVGLEEYFEMIKKPGENYVPSLVLTKDKSGKEFPADCRFNIVFDNAPDGFYGIQAQININSVNGTNYPYFYCVIAAKKDFGLEKYARRLTIPEGTTREFSKDTDAEVIVIRQRTTKTSGYHTGIDMQKAILEFSLDLARIIIEGNK